jgi:hypothetical protein
VDSLDYVRLLAEPVQPIEVVLDIGCGLKGIIGEYYWIHERPIKRGYMCDIHVLKPAQPVWTHLLMDAERLLDRLGPKSVDFVTHCGFLEHVDYDKALRVLHVIEQIACKRVFATCSAVMRDVNWKAEKDGNPNHLYRSWWDGVTMEALGYHVDRDRMSRGLTFSQETTFWYDPPELPPWPEREAAAIARLCARRCYVEGCGLEPVWWDPRTDQCACVAHYKELTGGGPETIDRWLLRDDFEEGFRTPPWRASWPKR